MKTLNKILNFLEVTFAYFCGVVITIITILVFFVWLLNELVYGFSRWVKSVLENWYFLAVIMDDETELL